MELHYPNGQLYHDDRDDTKPKHNKINPRTNYGKRGMSLEQEINQSNEYYVNHELAVIYKKPTPIQIVKVDYPARSQAVIREAYFKQASTTDYNGVYQGRYLDFEAKETKNKTSFPLKNFHQHQIDHMAHCLKQNGICFVIMKFVELDLVYLYPASPLISFWNNQNNGGRKSIPLKEIQTKGFKIQYRLNPMIPYLDAVDQLIELNKE